MNDSDAELLSALKSGENDQAIEELLRRYESRIYGFGMKMCRNPEDAKDVMQETLLAMARSLRNFRGASSVSTWLYTIARSFCIKKRRKSKFEPAEELSLSAVQLERQVPASAADQQPDQIVSSKELAEYLNRAVRSLEPMYREVIVLRDVEGLSASEVAKVLGLSERAVKSRLHRARLSIRAKLEPVLGVQQSRTVPAGTCPDVLTSFSRYLEGELDSTVCREMEQHLSGCENCRNECESLKRSLALCRESGSVSVPAEVQSSVRESLRLCLTKQELRS